ncbi:uncharacterized protein DUF3460 [Pseudoduganella flava]|uniref:DUF3460 family protein n=1 Tax=Pseudoduganella flava TaxID=871742 RepID=A0A562Q032_9BURK|nr:DUF3460 family protein [Pseudoduganella flava]QGZ38457.1 DUF3460 family protein [Pseudoduganella flava]TWI49993.1 uncharacterized protein DUF3460 [Pseudoduganella flava]
MKLTRYVSEYEQFLNRYKDEHPGVEAEQRRGWKIWWDHRQDLDAVDRQRRDTVQTKPYYYS